MTQQAPHPLRVLIVTHYYPPHLGGIEQVAREEAVRLAALGHEVTVLTSGERGGATVEDGVRVVRSRAWNGIELRTGVPFPVLGPGLLAQALRLARRADVVHIHDCLYPTSWAGGLAAAVTGTPHVLTQHVALVEHPSAAVRLVQRAVYATAGRLLLRRARSVHTLNATVTRFVLGHGVRRERAHHLPNGVDTGLFRPAASAAEQEAARRQFGLPLGRPLVLFAGRLVPKKGYDLLLRAADPAFELVFAGDGDRGPLTGQPQVHALGTLTPRQLADAYRACDAFALPSTAEGFPLTVQEAMASGLPVVTTDDPGYAPYELDADTAVLVPRDPETIRTRLRELALRPERRRHLGSRARAYAESRLAWPEHVETLLVRYRDAVGNGRRSGEGR